MLRAKNINKNYTKMIKIKIFNLNKIKKPNEIRLYACKILFYGKSDTA